MSADGPGIPLIVAALCAPLTGVSKRWPRVLHAIDMSELIRAWPDGTATAPCGAKRLRALYAKPQQVVLWPPRVASIPAGFERCQPCHKLTGRKRPRSTWKAALNG